MRGRRILAGIVCGVLVAGCGNDVDDAGAEWPRRDLKIMAPADPGGGWDTTAREMAKVIEDGKLIPKNVEVYNVSGAGGIIGLAQLAAKRKGEANQMMVMGLVMLGAIETNQAPLDISDTTPIAALTSEPEAIVVSADSDIRDLKDLVDRMKRTRARSRSPAARRAARTRSCSACSPRRAGSTRRRRSTSPTRAAARRTRRSSRARSRPASRARPSSRTRSKAGKMRVLAVSTAEPVQVGGKEAPTIRDAGFDVVVENWRGVVAPPDILPPSATRWSTRCERVHDTPEWKEALERNGWTDFFKPGDEFTAFLRDEDARVDEIIADLGLGG